MKKVIFHSLSHSSEMLFDPHARDACNEPYIRLKEELLKQGILFDTSKDHSLEDCEGIIFSEIISTYLGNKGKARKLKRKMTGLPSRNVFRECIKKGLGDKMILILAEPASVLPENWNLNLHSHFSKILTWNDSLVDGKKYIKIPAVPQPEKYPSSPLIPFKKKKMLVNISMNKSSSHPRELYSQRLKSIRYFEQHRPLDFDLFGYAWNQSKNWFTKELHQSYQGTVSNKWEVLPKYRFSLCYENLHGESGYITEKIFDSMRCSCVPIYWGADNVSEYVDTDAFIDRRTFLSNKELERYIASITETQYCEYLESIASYVKSEKFKQFQTSSWVRILLKTLKLHK